MPSGGRAILATISDLKNALVAALQQHDSDTRSAVVDAQHNTVNAVADSGAETNRRVTEVHQSLGEARNDVTGLRRDIAGLHAIIEGWRAAAAEARAAAEEARRAHEAALQQQVLGSQDTEIQDRPDTSLTPETPGDHPRLLLAAAGIAHARFDCHRDTWSFLVELAAQREHFRLPDVVEERGSGTLNVDISGRSLIAVLDALWEVRWNRSASAGTRALAERVYGRIDAALDAVESDQPSSPNYPHVIVDDRPPETADGPNPQPEAPSDPTRD